MVLVGNPTVIAAEFDCSKNVGLFVGRLGDEFEMFVFCRIFTSAQFLRVAKMSMKSERSE